MPMTDYFNTLVPSRSSNLSGTTKVFNLSEAQLAMAVREAVTVYAQEQLRTFDYCNRSTTSMTGYWHRQRHKTRQTAGNTV